MEKAKQASASSTQMDAIELLTEDHKKVKKLFKEFESLQKKEASKDQKAELVKEICLELTIHAQIEEEIFYPSVRSAIKEQDLMDEAQVEHASAKDLIHQLETMAPEDDLYDAKVTVLAEYIDHHVKEEEKEMFPLVKKTKLDMDKIGEDMSARKEKLKAGMEKSQPGRKKAAMTSGGTGKKAA